MIGFLALCVILVMAAPIAWRSVTRSTELHETAIAVEHTAPLSIRIARFISSGSTIVDIGSTGSGMIAVHLPATWQRLEVRGAPIASMTGEPQDWGYVRWVMPTGTVARFEALNPGRITLHNPSGIPLTVRTIRIDKERTTREDDAMIVTVDPFVLP